MRVTYFLVFLCLVRCLLKNIWTMNKGVLTNWLIAPLLVYLEMSWATHNGLSSRGPGAWQSRVAMLEVVRFRSCYTPQIRSTLDYPYHVQRGVCVICH
jgi:hypothetical protein